MNPLLIVLVAATALVPQGRADALVAADVTRAVHAYAHYTVFDDVRADVQEGIVTLTGKVTRAQKKDEIGKLTQAVDGVRGLRNTIAVLPPSTRDDDLRQRLARVIYGHAAFWQYAAMRNPPIHIVVEDGRVTLTGTVRSDADRALARSLATGQGETAMRCEIVVK